MEKILVLDRFISYKELSSKMNEIIDTLNFLNEEVMNIKECLSMMGDTLCLLKFCENLEKK